MPRASIRILLASFHLQRAAHDGRSSEDPDEVGHEPEGNRPRELDPRGHGAGGATKKTQALTCFGDFEGATREAEISILAQLAAGARRLATDGAVVEKLRGIAAAPSIIGALEESSSVGLTRTVSEVD